MKIKAYLPRLILSTLTISMLSSASATWIAKDKDKTIDEQQIKTYLSFQHATLEQVPTAKREKLLENWFIRESLANAAIKEKIDQSEEFQQTLKEFRQDLLAKLALTKLSKQKLPDFTERAKEIYQAEKNEKYHIPTRFKVKQIILDKDKKQLAEEIHHKLSKGEITIDAAIKQYSTDPLKKRLGKTDGFWFQKGQQSDLFYEQAERLSADKPLSDVFDDDNQLIVLYFIDKKNEQTTSFKDAKKDIISKLEHDYIETERSIILEKIKKEFATNISINPDFLN